MSKGSKEARDIQTRTNWKYSFCLFVVQQLGYERVSKEVDDASDPTELVGFALKGFILGFDTTYYRDI